MKINQNYLKLKESYLFSTISNKVKEYKSKNPEKKVINLGIGDVVLPLNKASVDAMRTAANEMSEKETFRGYSLERGYDFLRKALVYDYAKKNVLLDSDEFFISDGTKCDLGNILDIFSKNNKALIPNPVYPVYEDTNIMDGREIIYSEGNEENDFLPLPDNNLKCDIIYLCSPNNPTGSTYDGVSLKNWVDYAIKNQAILLFDAAYEAFIQDKNLPRSIYQIENAKKCAIEFGSFSKTAGFTGIRCGYTVVPNELIFENASLNSLWLRRQSTKFNGVSYVTQRAAEASLSEEGVNQNQEKICYYMKNAKMISEVLTKLSVWHTGGKNSPYIWLKCPQDMDSWSFFDFLLEKASVIGTPGAGFGINGKNFFRLSSFCDQENIKEALRRIEKLNFN